MTTLERHIMQPSSKNLKEENQLTGEEDTVEFFKWKFGKDISIEEARQINERVVVAFTLLAKWDRAQRLLEGSRRMLKERFARLLSTRPYIVIRLKTSA